MVVDPHLCSWPPQTATSGKLATAETSKAEPTKSIACGRRTKGSRRTELVTTNAATPIGMLMKNTHRHDKWSTKNPPRRGPATLAMANTPPV